MNGILYDRLICITKCRSLVLLEPFSTERWTSTPTVTLTSFNVKEMKMLPSPYFRGFGIQLHYPCKPRSFILILSNQSTFVNMPAVSPSLLVSIIEIRPLNNYMLWREHMIWSGQNGCAVIIFFCLWSLQLLQINHGPLYTFSDWNTPVSLFGWSCFHSCTLYLDLEISNRTAVIIQNRNYNPQVDYLI